MVRVDTSRARARASFGGLGARMVSPRYFTNDYAPAIGHGVKGRGSCSDHAVAQVGRLRLYTDGVGLSEVELR